MMAVAGELSRKETSSVGFLADERLTRFDIVGCHVIPARIVVHFHGQTL
jgi:hypothetical protein